jgi:hypothetical protein
MVKKTEGILGVKLKCNKDHILAVKVNFFKIHMQSFVFIAILIEGGRILG